MNVKHSHHKIFKCPICSRIFYRRSSRKSHVALIHRKRRDNVNLNKGENTAPKPDNFSIKCVSAKCKEVLDSWASMKYHQEMYHRKGIKRTFQCHLCRKTLVNRPTIRCHVESQHLCQYVCPFPICSMTFYQIRGLNWHIKCIHKRNLVFSATTAKFVEGKVAIGSNNGNDPVKCALPSCEEIFETYDAMVYHGESFHRPRIVKIFECFSCHRMFPRNWLLKMHMNHEHSHRDSFKCTSPMCSKIYYRKASLQIHMKREHGHGNARKVVYRTENKPLAKSNVPLDRNIENFPIKCSRGACKEVFGSEAASLYLREVSHRPGIWKSYECFVCKKSCANRVHLEQHMNALHGRQQKFKCPVSGCFAVFNFSTCIPRHLKRIQGKKVERRPRSKKVVYASCRGVRK